MPIGVHSGMESRSRARLEKDKGGEAGLDADRVASGNKSGKKVNIYPGAGDRFELDCSWALHEWPKPRVPSADVLLRRVRRTIYEKASAWGPKPHTTHLQPRAILRGAGGDA